MPKATLTSKRANLICASSGRTTSDTIAVVNVSADLLTTNHTLLKSFCAIAAVVLQAINANSMRSTCVTLTVVNVLTVQRRGELSSCKATHDKLGWALDPGC
jgi:hypothetical protein